MYIFLAVFCNMSYLIEVQKDKAYFCSGHIYLLSCYQINIDAKDKLTCAIKL